jgi:hypothetical protein
MRKILYSPGYGAGWVSWGGDTAEQKRFMLEYAPFVEALEGGAALRPVVRYSEEDTKYNGQTDPVIRRFIDDWREKFGDAPLPYFGGLRDLEVKIVDDGDVVRINEYDGSESVEVRGAFDGWL